MHVALGSIPSGTQAKREMGTGEVAQRFRALALPEVACSQLPGTPVLDLLPSSGFCGHLYTQCPFMQTYKKTCKNKKDDLSGCGGALL